MWNVQNNKGDTAILKAARFGHFDCLSMVIQAGACVNIPNTMQHTPLISAAIARNVQCVDAILSAGANVDAKDKYDRTALWISGYNGDKEIMKLLISAGANVNTKTCGSTVLMKAAFGGHVECVNLLITAGADVNACFTPGETALTQAVVCGHVNCMKSLLKSGAHVNTLRPQRIVQILKHRIEYDVKLGRKIFWLLKAAGQKVADSEGKVPFGKSSDISLRALCRNSVTYHLIKINLQENLFGRIPLLDIPLELKDYLLYHVSL